MSLEDLIQALLRNGQQRSQSRERIPRCNSLGSTKKPLPRAKELISKYNQN